MAVELKGLSLVTIPVKDNLDTQYDLIFVRISVSGIFDNGAEYKSFMRNIFATKLNGAAFSCPVRVNQLTNFPPDKDRDVLNRYRPFDNTPFTGVGNDLTFTADYSETTVSGFAYGNGIMTTATTMKFGNVSIGNYYTGGYSGSSGSTCYMPLVIFTDPFYNLYSFSAKIPAPIYGTMWAGVNNQSDPFPTVLWNANVLPIDGCTYISDVFDSVYTDGQASPITLSTKNIRDYIGNEVPIGGGGDDDDPFSDGGYAGGDDGDTGDFDYDGDPQPGNAPAPFHDGLDTGFYTLYAPSATELQNLATYLWSTNFDLNLFKRLFNNPMDLFLVLGILPVTIPKGSQKEVGIGLITTGVFMTTAASRVVSKDMGTIHVSGTTASYLDYAPYTHVDLLLPFVGVVPIDIDAIMGKDVNVLYNVDVLTGSCVAMINAGKTGAMHCIGAYAGNCMRSIPLTGADYTTMLSGLVQTAGAIAAGAAAGGAAGAVAGGLSAASSAVVNEGKPMIQKGGAISSSAGFMLGSNQMRPVLIFSLPKQCLPSLQMVEMGFPAYTSDKWDGGVRSLKILSDYKNGNKPTFVKVEEINLKSIHLTSTEIEELESILKEGIFV